MRLPKLNGLKLPVAAVSSDEDDAFDVQKKLSEYGPLLAQPHSDLAMQPENFRAEKLLGKGSQGAVYRATYLPTGLAVGQKAVTVESRESMKCIIEEIKSNSGAVHSNVVRYFGCFVVGNTINIVMEFMDMGSLGALVGRPLPEPVLSYIARQVLQGLHYLNHQRRLIHRDIKPENVMVNTRGEIKIGDFGISKLIEGTEGKGATFCGSKIYMSPERLEGKPHDLLSDIWSFGLTLYELALGQYPLSLGANPSIFDIIDAVKSRDLPAFPARFSPELAGFLRKTLQKEPAFRIRSTVLLNDPFIAQHKAFGPQDFIAFCKTL
mgnify:CR=1 FL=1